MKNYFKLLRFLKDHKPTFYTAVVIMFVASFFEVFQLSLLPPLIDRVFNDKSIIPANELPGFLSRAVDYLNSLDPKTIFKGLIIIFPIMLLVKNFLVFLYQYMMSDVSQRIMRDIRFNLYNKIQNLSLDYFSERRTGELVSRITFDANLIENAASYAVIDLFRQTFTIIFWVTTAFLIDPKAALVIFVIFPLIGFPMAQIGRRLKTISKSIQERMADINSFLLETISGIKLVKAFCTEKQEVDKFQAINQNYYKLRMKGIKRLVLISPITELIGGLFGLALVYWFASRVMSGELSTGVFILFFASVVSIISPVKKLGNVNALTQQALAANKRIYSILEEEATVKEKPGAKVISGFDKSIHLEHVDFHYIDESRKVLSDITLEVKKGDVVAVVGPTGTGKTTLVNLIPRFYDATKGRVTIDGVDVKDVTFQSLRDQFGIVTQETILFNDTVRNNIAYGKQDATQEEIEAAAKAAFAARFIEKLPKKYDTIIGDRGFRLSGGEKQRISIARAILRNAPILILDEATSQLDSESETYVQEALDKLMQGKTVVAIAHRLSTIKKADKIVVLDKGGIVGLGRHDELMKDCPLYQKLHGMQFNA